MEKRVWVAVFCASSGGARPEYLDAARTLGAALGALADAALASGAPVVGVLPAVLKDREIAHPSLSELHFVATMHERKALMAERADAFLALPGGFGTLDEFLEILTWAQLGIHAKPCILINLLGFYDGLLNFLDHAVREGFLQPRNRALIQVVTSVDEALDKLQAALYDKKL